MPHSQPSHHVQVLSLKFNPRLLRHMPPASLERYISRVVTGTLCVNSGLTFGASPPHLPTSLPPYPLGESDATRHTDRYTQWVNTLPGGALRGGPPAQRQNIRSRQLHPGLPGEAFYSVK